MASVTCQFRCEIPQGSQRQRQYIRSVIYGDLNPRGIQLRRPTQPSIRTGKMSPRASGKASTAAKGPLRVV